MKLKTFFFWCNFVFLVFDVSRQSTTIESTTGSLTTTIESTTGSLTTIIESTTSSSEGATENTLSSSNGTTENVASSKTTTETPTSSSAITTEITTKSSTAAAENTSSASNGTTAADDSYGSTSDSNSSTDSTIAQETGSTTTTTTTPSLTINGNETESTTEYKENGTTGNESTTLANTTSIPPSEATTSAQKHGKGGHSKTRVFFIVWSVFFFITLFISCFWWPLGTQEYPNFWYRDGSNIDASFLIKAVIVLIIFYFAWPLFWILSIYTHICRRRRPIPGPDVIYVNDRNGEDFRYDPPFQLETVNLDGNVGVRYTNQPATSENQIQSIRNIPERPMTEF